jgi:chromosome partitioning protein
MIVTFGTEKGGVAKTALARNLAAWAHTRGVRTCLVDTDRQMSAATWVAMRQKRAMPVCDVESHWNNPGKLGKTLQRLEGEYDLVVVDIPAQGYLQLAEAAKKSSLVLMPTSEDEDDVRSLQSSWDYLQALKLKSTKTLVVMAKVGTSLRAKQTEAAVRKRLANLGISVISSTLYDRDVWGESARTGSAIHELQNRQAKNEVLSFFDELLAIAGQEE